MTKKQQYDKDTDEYYNSILITPSEYKETIERRRHLHIHSYKATKGHTGITFYECACGDRAAGIEK